MRTGPAVPVNVSAELLSEGISSPEPLDASGQKRRKLLEQYNAMEESYAESVKALISLSGTLPQDVFQRVLEARQACETCWAALVDHEAPWKSHINEGR